ncbi:MAG: nicotinate phosphoribosyltransferase [Candidatus Omnitrophota bacterium]
MSVWVKGRRQKPDRFELPVEKIRSGWYSDTYFVRTREVLRKDGRRPNVLMQVFTREESVLCGIDEAIAVLKLCADRARRLRVRALNDGDRIKPLETVMTIEGDYTTFAHLETVYLGVMARRTAVATAVKKVVDAAKPKKVLFFPARFDHYSLQAGDGYAAFISGAFGVSTDANAAWRGTRGQGTIPHGLIAAYGGDTVQACEAFDRHMRKDIPRIALVDFENDSVRTSLEVARALGNKLFAVRLDTALDVKDVSVRSASTRSRGVTPELVRKVRTALDREGFRSVKIVVSCGFDERKIKEFNRMNVPYDFVGVGSAVFKTSRNFTADIVKVEGNDCSKVGRRYRPNPRLKKVKMH